MTHDHERPELQAADAGSSTVFFKFGLAQLKRLRWTAGGPGAAKTIIYVSFPLKFEQECAGSEKRVATVWWRRKRLRAVWLCVPDQRPAS